MRLWSFACDLYSKPGVEPALLTLQNEHGLVVNHVLFAAWLVAQDRSLDWEALLQNEQSTGLLADVIEPTRAFRLHAKGQVTDNLYQALKALELSLEKQHLEWLEQQATLSSPAPEVPFGSFPGQSVTQANVLGKQRENTQSRDSLQRGNMLQRELQQGNPLQTCQLLSQISAYLLARASLAETSDSECVSDDEVSVDSGLSADINDFIARALS